MMDQVYRQTEPDGVTGRDSLFLGQDARGQSIGSQKAANDQNYGDQDDLGALDKYFVEKALANDSDRDDEH